MHFIKYIATDIFQLFCVYIDVLLVLLCHAHTSLATRQLSDGQSGVTQSVLLVGHLSSSLTASPSDKTVRN
jgi:hypothetical protein